VPTGTPPVFPTLQNCASHPFLLFLSLLSWCDVHNGEEGLKEAEKWKPDLILLDIVMPMLDGIEVLKQLKANPETETIPVIMLTNLETNKDVARAMESGATGYLIKVNWTLEELREKVKEALR